MIKIINICCRYIVAFVFIFSGFVKLVDPYGTAYKISDYIELTNVALPFALALTFSVILSLLEFVVGINLLFKVFYQKTLRVLLLLISVFTGLTFYIALVDPVQDCGCFGDALVISNWATFIKNIVLLILSLELWRNRYYLRTRVVIRAQSLTLGLTLVFASLLALYAIRHLPFIDFRPYAVGTSIPDAIKVPDGEPQDVYQTTYFYEKDGKTKKFTEDNYPWQDTTWHYVDSESVLIEKGAEPAIHDFVLKHSVYGDITDEVLGDPNYTFFCVAPQLGEISYRHMDDFVAVASYCADMGYRFIVLTATVGVEADEFIRALGSRAELCNVDEIQLKTMVRAKPGLILIRDGVILAKYHHNDVPHFGQSRQPLSIVLTQQEKRESRIIVLFLALLLGLFYYKLMRNKDYSK